MGVPATLTRPADLAAAPATHPRAHGLRTPLPSLCPQRSTQSPGTAWGLPAPPRTFWNLPHDPPRPPAAHGVPGSVPGARDGKAHCFSSPLLTRGNRPREDPPFAKACTRRGAATWSCPVSRGHQPSHAGGHTETTARLGASPACERDRAGGTTGPGEQGAGGEWRCLGLPAVCWPQELAPPPPAPPTRHPLPSADTLTRLPEKIAC